MDPFEMPCVGSSVRQFYKILGGRGELSDGQICPDGNADLHLSSLIMKPGIYQDEGYQFMGAAFEVYNDRGYGMAEEIYQESLEIELELRGIAFQSKIELRCRYKGRELKKRYIPDLYVSG